MAKKGPPRTSGTPRKATEKKRKTAPAPDEKPAVERSEAPAGKDSAPAGEVFLVGIGASAGGLEALRALLPNLPVGMNAAYVITQHLAPAHPSMLASLLERFTRMPVAEVASNQTIKPDTVFICPPGQDLVVKKGRLSLSKSTTAVGPKPSVDYFFTSLAENFRERAVGIILSGTGSDGAHGIRAIKAEGGLTIVQDETSAKYNGMPHAAIETGNVDLVLPAEEIGKNLRDLLQHPRPLIVEPREEETPGSLPTILNLLVKKTGCDFSNYKPGTIMRRIERRMDIHRLGSLEDYVRFLHRNQQELFLLQKDILISVTSFFRDIEAFAALRKVLAEIIASKKKGDNIRIWVPGCSTGEEPYTIAIMLAQELGEWVNHYNVQIFASDLDQDAIDKGRRGMYPEATLVNVDPGIIERYFLHKDNMFQVVEPIREMLVFARQDLVRDPPFSRIDLISCRNLLIYFNSQLQDRVMPMFHYVLNPGGYLFLGKSESVGQFSDLFEPVDKKWKIFQRRGAFRAPAIDFGLPRHKYPRPSKPAVQPPEISVKDVMSEMMAEAYGCPGVLLDDRLEILFIRGDVSDYLKLPQGKAGLNIVDLVRSDLRIDLRTLLHQAARKDEAVRSKPIFLPGAEEGRRVRLTVRPVAMRDVPAGWLFVAFERVEPRPATEPEHSAGEPDPRVFELEQELTSSRERLQTTLEELETANEELQSMNEELQSTNEELQSSNEELETANEELQSTNEELLTVNDELQVKTGELTSANTDLENILKSLAMPMVIVDRELRVTRFTPAATRIFNLVGDSLGQVLTSIGCQVSIPELRECLVNVVEGSVCEEKELSVQERRYTMHVYPYLDGRNRHSGAVLMFSDNTEIEMALKERSLMALVDKMLLEVETLDQLYQDIARLIATHLDYPYAALALYDEEEGEMVFVGLAGVPGATPRRVPADKVLSGLVVKQGDPMTDLNATGKEDYSFTADAAIKVESFLCVPLISKQRVVGTISLGDEKARRSTRRDLALLTKLAGGLAREIEMQDVRKQLALVREKSDRQVTQLTENLAAAQKQLAGKRRELGRTREELAHFIDVLDHLFSSIGIMVAHLDAELNFLRVSRALAQNEGRTPRDFIGKNLAELYPGRERAELFRRTLRSGQPLQATGHPFADPKESGNGVGDWTWELQVLKDGEGQANGLLLSLVDPEQFCNPRKMR